MSFTIRTARPEDAPQLFEIYTPYVTDTAITFEYEVPTVEDFEQRIQETLKKYPYIVAEHEGEILGYAYASAFKNRAAYDWSVETSIYVRLGIHRQGIGRALYDELERLLRLQNVKNVNACIAYADPEDEHLSNDSERFHEKLGYTLVGRFHKCGYKYETWYDMIWMEKWIGEHEKTPKRFTAFGEIKNC